MSASESSPLLSRSQTLTNRLRFPRFNLQQRDYACIIILIALFFERIAFSATAAFVGVLKPVPFGLSMPFGLYNVIHGANIFGLLGPLISDSYFGRFSVTIFTYIVYILGYAGAMVGYNLDETPDRISPMIGVCLIIIYCADGILISILPAFAGDQLHEQPAEEMRRFLRYYYMVMSFGLGLGFMYTHFYFSTKTTFTDIHIYLCIAPILVSMVLSFIVFLVGLRVYVRRTPQTSTLPKFIKITAYSIKQKWLQRRIPQCEKPPSLFDYATLVYGGEYSIPHVEDTKSMWRVFRVHVLLIITYLMVFFRTPVSLRVYGMTESFTIVLVIPIIGLVYKSLSKYIRVSVERRLIIGQFFLALSVFYGAVLEKTGPDITGYRKPPSCSSEENPSYDNQNHLNEQFKYITAQYVLQGISEVLVFLTGLEYVFSESPKSLRGLTVGTYWFSYGVGNLLSLLIFTYIIPQCICSGRSRCCGSEYYFSIFWGVFVLVGAFVIWLCGRYCDLRLIKEIHSPRVVAIPPTPDLPRRFHTSMSSSNTSYSS